MHTCTRQRPQWGVPHTGAEPTALVCPASACGVPYEAEFAFLERLVVLCAGSLTVPLRTASKEVP